MAVTPDGQALLVPTVFLDNKTVIPEVREDMPPPPDTGYGGKVIPAMTVVQLDGSGIPDRARIASIPLSSDLLGPTSYPVGVTVSPKGDVATLPLEGAMTVAVVNLAQARSAPEREDIIIVDTGRLEVGEGPQSVTFTGGQYSFRLQLHGRRGSRLQRRRAPGRLADHFGPRVRRQPAAGDQAGRRLFYSTVDATVTNPRFGVSCATCHFEGRADGLTWSFERGPRQTPSLAGMVSLREPVRWDGLAATVADDALQTSQGLMGSMGMNLEVAQSIAAFIDYVRAVDNPNQDADTAQVRLGREIFNRSDVACGTCHAGPLFTDKQLYDNMFGLDGVKTPSLIGIVATPPYLHDGSAPTLRAVLDAARDGSMGNTGALSDEEMDALEAYLRTL